MKRLTIDFGIDLGTTNSSIAVLNGATTEIIKNNDSQEITPSAVWIDRKDRLHVGRGAKERIDEDPDNGFAEFKLQMGTDAEYLFKRSGRRMRPEELSAEVLKSLKADVKKRMDEDIRAAVITVPAAFELPQCNTTKRAAELAGIEISPLLQEPVAAALAYGFQSESEKAYWLVYDLGGGTFDAAVMQVRDGRIRVVNHGGDNHLGGKHIDWAIVDQLLIPAVSKQSDLRDFNRTSPKWRTAIAKLKLAAEDAKIKLSHVESADIIIEYLCQDERGEPVEFEYELKRKDVARLAEPFVLRSINICKRVLTEKGLDVDDIERILLVGGPTLSPYIREQLASELSIAIDFSHDPLTVVSRGAAIFAGTQRVESSNQRTASPGCFTVELIYDPIGEDTEPHIGGRVLSAGNEPLGGFTIEFINDESRPPWRSGKLRLEPNGVFTTTLWAEKRRANTFLIELFDSSGIKRETIPDRLCYTVGRAMTEQVLTHNIGVATADNKVKVLFRKGSPLPAREASVPFKTTSPVQRGRATDRITIPIVEGEHRLADRNERVGSLEILGDNERIKRDIPIGSDVELTIAIDESRVLWAKAFIPLLDEEIEFKYNIEEYRKQAENPEQIAKDLLREQRRLDEARGKASDVSDPIADEKLRRIDEEALVEQVENGLKTASVNRDAAELCHSKLLSLKSAIDEVEEALEWPALLVEAQELITATKNVVSNYGDDKERQMVADLERELRRVMDPGNTDALRVKVEQLRDLYYRVWLRRPEPWLNMLEDLRAQRSEMRNLAQADRLFVQADRAVNEGELPVLRSAVRQLLSYLPDEQQEELKKAYGSTVLAAR